MKKISLFVTHFVIIISLFAQITREQADAIVFEHLQKVVTEPYLLYVNVKAPSEAGIDLTTSNAENMKIKYACWAYYLNEHSGVSEPTQHRYLFVKENDGNLLEVITSNDLGPNNLTEWTLVEPDGIIEIEKASIHIFPNPTTGELKIESSRFKVQSVEVFDVYGRNLTPHTPYPTPLTTINIFHLKSGIYFIKIETETGVITKKVIKK